ncbi:hypothetical protein J2Z32_004332 [Paenibacillus turicensis]|uniref:Uncharacterized protein n=1 Tax=Paenibacillus turicensis TaxID=160487 RepID=A0ABS4FYK3_9BACL|nr:hypothetical protein [Paenibacillus turicensis]MBP1907652.1 hypothetical protein [Paenibacillus turicensis]
MSDKLEAIEVVIKFLNDSNSKTLLMKGYDNDAKLRVVLSCLNKHFDKGIIRTSSMSNIPDLINGTFNKRLLPNTIKSTAVYRIGKITVNISSYTTNTSKNPLGNHNTFTIFFPVQTVLDDSKRYKKFLTELKNTNSKKVILITTNEWGIENWDIENQVDQVFFYSVEEDNPQLMNNLRSNGAIPRLV